MRFGPRFARYAWPVLSTLAALALRLLLDPVLGSRIPYATFYAAIAISTILGGAPSGILATILGGLAAAYYIVSPEYSFYIAGTDNQIAFVVYLFVSAILIALANTQRQAKLRLEEEVANRRDAERSERLQRQQFEVTLASIGDGVIATDAAGRITFMNHVAAELTGWAAPEAIGRPLGSVFVIRNEETGSPVENPAERAIREGRIVGLANHTVLLSKDGRRLPIDDSGAPMVDSNGKIIGAVLVFRDVSDARAAEMELRNRNRMIDLSHDAIFVMDAGRHITAWNLGARELYGWDEDEARGQISHVLLKSQGPLPMAEVDEILRRDGRWDGELIHTAKDGREIVTESRQVLLRDAGGAVTGILEINRDVTDRKRAEKELRRVAAEAEEGRRTLEAVMEYLPEGLTIADAPDVRIRMVSRHGAELTGRARKQLENIAATEQVSAWGIYYPDGKTPAQPQDLPLTRAVLHGQITADEEWVIRRPDGEGIVALCNAAPIRDAEGQITGGLIAWRDITQRKRLEEKLRETAKLESLGILAGGIAHDFNNLLTGVLGNASLLLEDIPERSELRTYVEGISSAAERAARLSQQMLAYSGRGRFVVETVDLAEYIRQTKPLLRSSIPKYVDLRLELAGELPPVEADSAQLQQLVMNLVINAAEAIGPSGGCVTLGVSVQEADETYIRTLLLDGQLKPGTCVALEVSDTGCGMDERTLARIFDPFFTTKFTGRGLGLAAVQGIVRGHKGAMKVYSAPGQGTTFRVLFPAVAGTTTEPEASVSERSRNGSGTVLVIDDEEVVRATASGALRRLGYTVVVASHGAEGIAVFRALRDRITVVLLDMTMPGMSGEETMHELRKIKPGIPIVLSSGFSETEALRRFGHHGLAGFLQKPYTVSTLAERLSAAAAGTT